MDDFLPEEKLDYLKYIENSISSEIKKEVTDNHISEAFYGGIDSNLVMALLRKQNQISKLMQFLQNLQIVLMKQILQQRLLKILTRNIM